MVTEQDGKFLANVFLGGMQSCIKGAVAPRFDAYDCPAIFLGGDSDLAREMRAVLQSLGFDVLAGTSHLGADDDPVFIVLDGFLDQKANREHLERVKRPWPSAPVISLSNPADVAGKLITLLS